MKKIFEKMSLKKSLILLAVLCLGTVCILTIVTILNFSNLRQKILDNRSIQISQYTVKEDNINYGITLVDPQEYEFEALTGENLFYYVVITVLMLGLPVVYVIVGALVMAKLYYKLKIQIPLKHLNNGVEHISKQDLDFEMNYFADDELGRLCNAFELMKKEIYLSNVKMWDMLEEKKALNASMSHDLRTPLTVINGYLDYLDKASCKQVVTDEILQATIKNIKGAIKRLERYVECVKDIQKIEDVEIKKEYFDLKEYLEDTIKDFTLLVQTHKRVLRVHNFINTQTIFEDKNMLSKVLENVFDNAIRFSKEIITFSIFEDDEYIMFVIEDDGNGFCDQELECATMFFYSSSKNHYGFGIGLSISQIICKKLGGTLILKNNQYHGAKVTIQIKK